MNGNQQRKAEELLRKSAPAISTENDMGEKRAELAKKVEKLSSDLEPFKKDALKKFPYISSISIIPPEASKLFEDDIIKNEKEKPQFHLYITIPDDKVKKYNKVKTALIKASQAIKPKIWIHLSLISDIWEICNDGKFEMVDAIAASIVLHDKGILGSLRVANVHKILCLRKFENYIVSYVIAGSLVRGTATKTSDIDVTIIIDDTDVKRMTRLELRDRLRGIISDYVFDAGEISGVKNKLNAQVWLLTDFWEGIREAHPVYFTFVRDGVPLYDNRTFTPWKLLLKMGRITGTPEAIEKFISQGEGMTKVVKRKLLDIATGEIYWSILTPSQGALMLYGLAPPTPKETITAMEETFYKKEKLLEKKYLDFLKRVVDMYKGYEHGKVTEVSGKEIDELVKGSEEYLTRIKKLVEEVGSRISKKTIINLHEDIMKILKTMLGKGSEAALLRKFKSDLIQKGKMPSTTLKILEEVIKAKKKYSSSKGKITKVEVERIRKDAQQLISTLTEYAQRGKLAEMERARLLIHVGDKVGELHLSGKKAFIVVGEKHAEITLIDLEKNKVSKAKAEDLNKALSKPTKTKITTTLLSKIEKLLGKKIEIML